MLSVVIPTLNAAATLAHTLEAVAAADQIVVADGGSADTTVSIADGSEATVILAERGRGAQLRAGAEAAQGDWLLFLHADTAPGRGWRTAVERHIARAPDLAGTFRFRLDDPSRRARLVERGVALRVALLGLPYGDQGLLISRSLYDQVGGYRPLPLMEDVDLIRRIGRRRLRTLGENALTSAERWRREGWIRRSARNLALLLAWRAGVSTERLARLYG